MNSPSEPTPREVLGELRDGIREPDWQRMEANLLTAFAARADAAPSEPPALAAVTEPPVWIWRGRTWGWMGAAAVLVLAAAITFAPVPRRDGKPPLPAPAPQPAPLPAATPPPAATAAPALRAAPAAAPAVKAPAAARRPAAGQSADRGAHSSPSGFDGFVVLPSAFALPDFESGRIVRVEVPLTGLPAYGLDLVPDAAPSSVQADVLIGQDGMPRAIRLASYSQR